MNVEYIETYSDRIPNEWVEYTPDNNWYFLKRLVFNKETKELESVKDNSYTSVRFLVGIGDTPQDGIITEQLTAILIHRHEEFNKKLPSEQGTKIVEHLKEVVRLTEERIEDRKNRGVHGENNL